MGRKQPPLCVSFNIINTLRLKDFSREAYSATKQSISSLEEAYQLCRRNQRTVICFWQKNAGRLGIANYKAILEPRSLMSIPEVESVKLEGDKHPQMIESSYSLALPCSFYTQDGKKHGHEGVTMTEYTTNYDELTKRFDQRSRPKKQYKK